MWCYTEPSTLYHEAKIAQHYDGIFFVQHIAAVRPISALSKVLNEANGSSRKRRPSSPPGYGVLDLQENGR